MRDLLKYADAHSQMDLTSSFDEFFSLLSDANKDIGSIPAFTRLQKTSFIVDQSIESMFNALSIKNIDFKKKSAKFFDFIEKAEQVDKEVQQQTLGLELGEDFDIKFNGT